MYKGSKKIICVYLLLLAFIPSVVLAETSDDWEFGLSIYGWFPDIAGQTAFPVGGGEDFEVSVGDILDNLQFTLQGSFDARKGQWGLFSDMIYLNLGNSDAVIKDGSIGGQDWPVEVTAAVNFDMKSLIWTNAAYYRLVDEPKASFDLLGGVRYASIKQSLDWSFSGDIGQLPVPGREGSSSVKPTYWDAVIGLRGHAGLGDSNKWFIPYYLDIGTGDSDFTWQAAGGIAYTFKWGQMAALWRYLDYNLPNDGPIADMNFSGPEVGAVFRW